MRKILGFASLTLMTQFMLLLQQVALLPLQIRMWGHDLTAGWYAAIAVAAMTSVADIGLRSAGHAELMRLIRDSHDAAAHGQFREVWAWIRILVGLLTLVIASISCAVDVFSGSGLMVWKTALIMAGGLETILTIRIVYLDSVGWYNSAESGYLIFVVVRLLASLIALTVFDARATSLAAIYLISVILALGFQSVMCWRVGVLRLFGGLLPGPSVRMLATTRHTFAGPCALWTQMHLPVLILSNIASPVAVTAYVTLRAIFGVARQTAQQASRAASVEYIRLIEGHRRQDADAIISILMIVISCIGAWVACLVMIESRTVLRFIDLTNGADFFRLAALTFGLSGSFLSYYIPMTVVMRQGRLDDIARRQYCYVIVAMIGALIALVTRWSGGYLLLAAGAEIVMAILFLVHHPSKAGVAGGVRPGRRAMAAAGVSAASVLVVWAVTTTQPAFSLDREAGLDIVASTVAVMIVATLIGALQVFINRDLCRLLLPSWRGRHTWQR